MQPADTAPARRPSTRAQKALLVVALVFLVKEAQPLLAPIVIAVVLTFVMSPGVHALRRRGVPEVIGAGVLVLALMGSSVPLALTLAAPAAEWWERAPTTVSQLLVQFDRLRAAIPGMAPPSPASAPAPSPRNRAAAAATAAAAAAVPAQADPVKDRLASEGLALTGFLLGRGVSFAISAAATLILLYFLLASEHWMLRRTVEAIPRRRSRALLVGGIRAAQREIGRFMLALGCINLGVGVVTGLVLHAIGLPNPLLWGVVVGVLNFIPYIGPMVIVGMLTVAGVLHFAELGPMLAPAVVFMAVHAVEANVISPWFVGRRLSLSPIAVFLSVMLWGWLWGIAGALIAVPMLIALRSICRRDRRLRLMCAYLEGDLRPIPSLRALLRPRRRGADAVGRDLTVRDGVEHAAAAGGERPQRADDADAVAGALASVRSDARSPGSWP